MAQDMVGMVGALWLVWWAK